MSEPPDPTELLARIDDLIAMLVRAADAQRGAIDAVHPLNRASAINLVHYLALRRIDLRPLQRALAQLGLSSLGHAEGHVLGSITRVRARLRDMLVAAGTPTAPPPTVADPLNTSASHALLHRNAHALFGPKPAPRHVYIMVTLPEVGAVTPAWAHEVLVAGANCFRVNTAHDAVADWTDAIATIRAEAARMGRAVRVLVDLEGPKLRTLPLGPGLHVHKLRPPKDELGAGAGALAVALTTTVTSTSIPIPAAALARLRSGDELRFRDARGKKRRLVVGGGDTDRLEILLESTTYFTDATEIAVRRAGREVARFHPGPLPHVETSVRIDRDDQFWLVDEAAPTGASGRGFLAVPISLPEILPAIAVGQRVFIDDGKLEAVATERHAGRVLCRVVRTPAGRFRLRGAMGINLPDTPTVGALDAMSAKDHDSLAFAVAHADMVGLSFVRTAGDVAAIRERVAAAARPVGLVLKIETSSGFRHLGELLLDALHYHPVAVMIARGDLAVEVGFERLAELQEEILWLCEAAHVPVIWATQVLESLAKAGLPSRGEVTDAAMSVRAECVMLNKGDYVARAVEMLDAILRRMEAHQYKKMALSRELLFR